MRKYNWVPAVMVFVAVVGYFIAWPWYKDRQVGAAVDALVADLDEQGEKAERPLTDFPANATKDEVGKQAGEVLARMKEAQDKTREFQARAEELVPKAKEDKRQQLRQALERYTERAGRAQEKLKERADQIRTQRETAKGP